MIISLINFFKYKIKYKINIKKNIYYNNNNKMQPICVPPMNPVLHQDFNPNMDYGPMPQMASNDPRYLDLLKKYNTLLKMYRSRPATQQIRMGLPRNTEYGYDAERRLPILQKQYPQTLKNLEQYANRLNLQFNPVNLTDTSEFLKKNSIGQSTEKEYDELLRELGMSSSKSKRGRKRTKRTKSIAGGKSRKKRNYTKRRK